MQKEAYIYLRMKGWLIKLTKLANVTAQPKRTPLTLQLAGVVQQKENSSDVKLLRNKVCGLSSPTGSSDITVESFEYT